MRWKVTVIGLDALV